MEVFTEWLKKHILEWVKEYPKYFLPFGLFASLCLFLPDKILTATGLLDLRNQFKPYLGAAFLLSITFIFTAAFLKIYEWTRDIYFKWITKRRIIKRLSHISPEESDILIGYIKEKTYTQRLRTMNGVVNGLAEDGIIYQSSRLTRDPNFIDFNMNHWIWDYLNTHPEIFTHK